MLGPPGSSEIYEKMSNELVATATPVLSKDVPFIHLAGMSKLLASLDHTERRRVVLGHTLNAL